LSTAVRAVVFNGCSLEGRECCKLGIEFGQTSEISNVCTPVLYEEGGLLNILLRDGLSPPNRDLFASNGVVGRFVFIACYVKCLTKLFR